MAILPELALLTGALAFFVMSLSKSFDKKQFNNAAVFMGVVALLGAIISFNQDVTIFAGAYQVDLYSQFFKLMIAMGMVFALIAGQGLKGIEEEDQPEYYMFMFVSCLGLMCLVSSVELITLFISLELSSFALYLMVPMRDNTTGVREQMEAGIKYILFGVLATGFMLFGMSYIFGLTGTTYLKEIVVGMEQVSSQPAALFAIVMVLAGFFYKLAVFPMHFWVPDVYEGAANETTAFVATVPKLGAVALMIRFVAMVPVDNQIFVNLLIAMSLCSMFYGNLIALVQTDVKRMLGFSGIAHAGFILLGLLTLDVSGYATVMYYISGYVFMNIACYIAICSVSDHGENIAISDLNGLHKRQPMMAFLLAVGLFALAGIPPMIGFMGEFLLLAGALQAGHLYLVILAAINAGIAIYYYLRVVKAAYTADPEDRPDVTINGVTRFASVVLVLLIVMMGAFPTRIISFADTALKTIL